MNYHNKYQKKGQFLLHPGLIEFRRSGWGFQIQFNSIAVLILGLMKIYPTALMSFDLTFALLVVGFWMIGRHFMLKGKLPFKTYYKRDYQNDNFLFFSKMILLGSIVRTTIVALYFALQLYVAKGDKYEIREFHRDIWEVLFNPLPQAIAIGIFLFLFYYMFLKEKYISIEGFTIQVMQIVRDKKFSINDAVRQFIYKRDLALEKEMIEGVKYGYNEEQNHELVKDNRQKEINNEPTIESFPEQESSMPLRRQSRR